MIELQSGETGHLVGFPRHHALLYDLSSDGLDSMGDFSDTALLGSTDEGETALRLQFQLVF